MLTNLQKNSLKVMNVTETGKLVNKYISELNKIFEKDNQNFAGLCFYTFKLKELFTNYTYTVRDNNSNTCDFDFIMKGFGIDNSQSSRLISCYEKFCTKLENEKTKILDEFTDFSKSKLFELLVIPTEQLILDLQNQVLRADMSVKTIRDYVKNYKTMQKQNKKLDNKKNDNTNIIEEDIPEAYNPKQHYDFAYFEKKSKAQLLNIIWDLQNEYEKLKTTIKEKK